MVKVFREVKRVLRDDGTCWLNLGDSYASSTSTTGGYSDKSTLIGYTGEHTKGREMNKAENPIKKELGNLKPKDLVGIPWRVAFALQADGWYLRQDIVWHKPNPMPESVTDRCTKSHEYIFLLTKSAKYYYDNDAIREPHKEESLNRVKGKWNGHREKGSSYSEMDIKKMCHENGRNKRDVWTINTQSYKEAHFAVFPPKIPELCIKAGSKEGDTVLDPFFGSGTTGWVAQRLGRKWIGIELNAEYIKIAEKRFIQHELF